LDYRKINFYVDLFCYFKNMYYLCALKDKSMLKKVEIVLAQGGTKANLYSFRYQGETYSEFEKFLLKYKANEEYAEDFKVVLARLWFFINNGANDRYFRREAKMIDRVLGLPANYLDTSRLRLYCIKLSDSALILGNGDEKHTETYQEDTKLLKYVETLQKLDFQIFQKEKRKLVKISGMEILGELTFEIDD